MARSDRGRRPQIFATIDPELHSLIEAEVAQGFESVSSVIEARLRASYGQTETLPKTVLADARQRSLVALADMRELELRKARGSVVEVEHAHKVFSRCFAIVRQKCLQLHIDVDVPDQYRPVIAAEVQRMFSEIQTVRNEDYHDDGTKRKSRTPTHA